MRLAICSIVRNEERYIEEWLAFHLLQGACRILIYDDGSTDRTCSIIDRISKQAPVELINWKENSTSFDRAQRNAYQDAVRRLHQMDFVAFIDIDEFVYSKNEKTLSEELKTFSGEVSAIAINQRVFGSSGNTTYRCAPVVSRFLKSTHPDHPENRWFKTIARPNRVIYFDSVHSVQTYWGRYVLNDNSLLKRNAQTPGCATDIGRGMISLNHYMLKSLEEYRLKQLRASDRGMRERYNEDYFHARDTLEWANNVDDYFLNKMTNSILKKIDKISHEG